VTINTPAIIPKSLFAKAQAQLRNNRRNSPRRTKTLYLLRGLLVCGHDNRRIQAARRPADRFRECKYYFCSGTRKDVAAVRCPSRSISESRIAPPVWDKLTDLLTHPTIVLKQIAEYRKQILEPAHVADQIESLRRTKQKVIDRQQRLVELYLSSVIDAKFFQAENLSLKLEVDRLDSELERTRSLQMSEQEVASRAQSLQQIFERYKDKLAEASDEVKRELLTLFINRVTVRGEELEICVNLPEPDAFVGQSPHPLSHKETLQIFLRAKLVPISEIFRQKELYKNFWVRQDFSDRQGANEDSS
jgi:hypothetical protein